MKAVYELISKLAEIDTAVLIEGETGTGKELVAQALHLHGPRKDKPFVAVNCAALTETIAASQLLGHKRGSFTGAVQDQKGFFEVANEGTILLDEIGDFPLHLQPLLLRVLDEKAIVPLGEPRPRSVDVRILIATNHVLEESVKEGLFRLDLYFRLRVCKIRIPALWERREDIKPLVDYFLDLFNRSLKKKIDRISKKALQLLVSHDWPGNVRELKNAIESAIIQCETSIIEPEDLPPEIQTGSGVYSGSETRDEKKKFLDALKAADGNKAKAARLLGMSRATFYRRLAKYKPDAGG